MCVPGRICKGLSLPQLNWGYPTNTVISLPGWQTREHRHLPACVLGSEERSEKKERPGREEAGACLPRYPLSKQHCLHQQAKEGVGENLCEFLKRNNSICLWEGLWNGRHWEQFVNCSCLLPCQASIDIKCMDSVQETKRLNKWLCLLGRKNFLLLFKVLSLINRQKKQSLITYIHKPQNIIETQNNDQSRQILYTLDKETNIYEELEGLGKCRFGNFS